MRRGDQGGSATAGQGIDRRGFLGAAAATTAGLLGGASEAATSSGRPRPNIVLVLLDDFGIGYSWGGFESLVIPFDPARARSATPWPPAGWAGEDKLGVRLSIGLEDPEDLIADLARGFAALANR